MINVSKDKLYSALEKRGVNTVKASIEFGFSSKYLSNAASCGKINKSCAILLERIYNIKREEYEVVEEQPVRNDEPTSDTQFWKMTKDELYQTIYAAVYHAVKKAWSE